MSDDIVDLDGLAKLTGRVMPTAQVRELKHLQIPYHLRRDGSILVLWSDVRLTRVVATATVSPSGPNFEALNRRSK